MPTTVLFRAEGLLQSYGVDARFKERTSQLETSKAAAASWGCMALHIDRDDNVGLRKVAAGIMGVRVDRKGRLVKDFQTAHNVLRVQADIVRVIQTGGTKGDIKPTETMHKYYLSDASFLVGLEYPDDTIPKQIYAGLKNPSYVIHLGRKCCLPSKPLWSAGPPVNLPVFEALQQAELPDSYWSFYEKELGEKRVLYVLEDKTMTSGDVRFDQPLSFSLKNRKFTERHVETREVMVTRETVEKDVWIPIPA